MPIFYSLSFEFEHCLVGFRIRILMWFILSYCSHNWVYLCFRLKACPRCRISFFLSRVFTLDFLNLVAVSFTCDEVPCFYRWIALLLGRAMHSHHFKAETALLALLFGRALYSFSWNSTPCNCSEEG